MAGARLRVEKTHACLSTPFENFSADCAVHPTSFLLLPWTCLKEVVALLERVIMTGERGSLRRWGRMSIETAMMKLMFQTSAVVPVNLSVQDCLATSGR